MSHGTGTCSAALMSYNEKHSHSPPAGYQTLDDDLSPIAQTQQLSAEGGKPNSGLANTLKQLADGGFGFRNDDAGYSDHLYFMFVGDAGQLRAWLLVTPLALVLLAVPTLIKLCVSGNLGCEPNGCGQNLADNRFNTIGHATQGVLLALVLLPWPFDYSHPCGLSCCVPPSTVCHIKNILMVVGTTYPVYNAIKRSITSCSGIHLSFWQSSFFLNEGIIAAACLLAVLIGTVLMYTMHPKQGRRDLGFACEETSFRTCATLLVIILVGVDIVAAILSVEEDC